MSKPSERPLQKNERVILFHEGRKKNCHFVSEDKHHISLNCCGLLVLLNKYNADYMILHHDPNTMQ